MDIVGVEIQCGNPGDRVISGQGIVVLVNGKPMPHVIAADVQIACDEAVKATLTVALSNVHINGALGMLVGEHDGKLYNLTEAG